jgi:hypothetical protein
LTSGICACAWVIPRVISAFFGSELCPFASITVTGVVAASPFSTSVGGIPTPRRSSSPAASQIVLYGVSLSRSAWEMLYPPRVDCVNYISVTTYWSELVSILRVQRALRGSKHRRFGERDCHCQIYWKWANIIGGDNNSGSER